MPQKRDDDDQSPQYFNSNGVDGLSEGLAGDALGGFFQERFEEGGQDVTLEGVSLLGSPFESPQFRRKSFPDQEDALRLDAVEEILEV